MPRNKNNIDKTNTNQIKTIQPVIKLTNQQKMSQLVNQTNLFMYTSLQQGHITINQHNKDKIANKLVKIKIQQINKKILSGDVMVNQIQIPFNIIGQRRKMFIRNRQGNYNQSEVQGQQQDKLMDSGRPKRIFTINENLLKLKESLVRERQMQRQQSYRLENQAKEFIQKMRKDKQEFHEKIRNKKSTSRLLIRAYSQDTIKKMKDNLEKRVYDKRRELEEKIMKIKKRNKERVQLQVEKEINYWERLKGHGLKKNQSRMIGQSQRAVSEKLLPQIKNTKYTSEKNQINNKNIRSVSLKKYENSRISSQNMVEQFDRNILKAKLKMNVFNKKDKQRENYVRYMMDEKENPENKIIDNKMIDKKNVDIFALKYSDKRYKIIGDEYLKQSLNQVKTKKSHHRNLLPLLGSPKKKDQNTRQNILDLSINASNINPSINPHHFALQQSWQRTLKKMQFHQLSKLKGLQILSGIEKKLDKYDKEGMTIRLRDKIQTVNRLQNDNEFENDDLMLMINDEEQHDNDYHMTFKEGNVTTNSRRIEEQNIMKNYRNQCNLEQNNNQDEEMDVDAILQNKSSNKGGLGLMENNNSENEFINNSKKIFNLNG